MVIFWLGAVVFQVVTNADVEPSTAIGRPRAAAILLLLISETAPAPMSRWGVAMADMAVCCSVDIVRVMVLLEMVLEEAPSSDMPSVDSASRTCIWS